MDDDLALIYSHQEIRRAGGEYSLGLARKANISSEGRE
jgi:hypothetical protein